MSTLVIALWLVSPPILLLSIELQRRPPTSRLWRTITIAGATLATTITAGFYSVALGWLMAVPVSLLACSAILLGSAYRWALNRWILRRAETALIANPELKESVERNAFLRTLKRMADAQFHSEDREPK